jgi:hypothetical protein
VQAVNNIKGGSDMGDKGEKAKLKLTIDENGVIIEAKEQGNGGDHDPEYEDPNKTLTNSNTQLRSPNYCCWRKVGGRWRCRPEYC